MSATLPDELNLQIFAYLTTRNDFLAALGVCRLWRRLMADPMISRALGYRDDPDAFHEGFYLNQALALVQHHPGIRLHLRVDPFSVETLLTCDEASQLQLAQATDRLTINWAGKSDPEAIDRATEHRVVDLFTAPRGTLRRFRGRLPTPEQCAALTHVQYAAFGGSYKDERERLASAAHFPALRILNSKHSARSYTDAAVTPAPQVEELMGYKGFDTTPLLVQFPNLHRLDLHWAKTHTLGPLAQQLTHLTVLLNGATLAELASNSGPFSCLVELVVRAPETTPFSIDELRALATIVRGAPSLRVLRLRLALTHGRHDMQALAPSMAPILLVDTRLDEVEFLFPFFVPELDSEDDDGGDGVTENEGPALAELLAALFPTDPTAAVARDDAIDWHEYGSQPPDGPAACFVGRWAWGGVIWRVWVPANVNSKSWVKLNLSRCTWPHA